MINNKNYSYLLVASQFTCIALLLALNLSMFTKIIPTSIFICGIVFFIYTLSCNKISNFNIRPDIKKNASLVTNGAYRYIRHPMYFALFITVLAPLASSFDYTNIIICTLLGVTIFFKAKREEYLWHAKSEKYKSYTKKTKMIIPFII